MRRWYAFREDKISAVNEKYRHIDFSKSVGLHLRLGDMLNNHRYVIAPYRYYVKALSKVRAKENILVFSDEIETARKYLQGLKGNIIYMEDNKDYEDLYLFTQCHDFICSNSTLSWWGAWLNEYEEKIIVCPKEWIRPGCGVANDDLCCNGWVPLRTTVPVLDDYRIFRLRQRLKKGIERCINYAARR
jgi:hypothetical protein